MATPRWRGNAANITQVDTITVANTWAEDDTATITINGNDIVCTVGSSDTTGDVAALISAAINASASSASATAGDYNIGGQEIPEFTEVTATVAGSVVTVTANTAGKPFTMSVTESTAGDGTATEATATAATGKHFWSNADNWSTGSVPANADDVWFDSGDVDCKYGLPAGSLEPNSIHVTLGYTGKIGLPEINKDSGVAATYYREYRSRYVSLDNDATASNTYIYSGEGVGSGSPMVNIDWDSSTATIVYVFGTGTAQSGVSDYALNVTGTGSSMTFYVAKGSVGIAPEPASVCVVKTLNIGYASQQSTDATVYCGSGASVTNDVFQHGGTLVYDGTFSTASVTQFAGTSYYNGVTIGNLEIYATAICDVNAVIVSLVYVSGELRMLRPDATNAFTTTQLTSGATLRDPNKTGSYSNGIDLIQCGVQDVTLDIGRHYTIARTAI